MSQQLIGVEAEPIRRQPLSTYARVPGVRLLGRYEGSGWVDPRFIVVRPDGQTVMLTHLLYLVVQFADPRLDPAAQATLISREYGRLLPVEHLDRLVTSRLAPAGLVATPGTAGTGTSEGASASPSRPLLSVTLKGPLVPTWVVRKIARSLAPAFHPAVVCVVLLAFVALDAHLIAATRNGGSGLVLQRPSDLLALVALLMSATILHEFGHAAGCHYGGGRPGAIGAALYLWMPVFWTEVTDAYRLDRRGRVRTDLGGIYFNALFIVIAATGYALTGWVPLAAAALINNVLIPQQLVPFVRLDGYYLLGDLTGVPNLFGLVRPILRSLIPGSTVDPRVAGLRRGTRVVVTLWVLLTVIVLSSSLVMLVVGMPTLVRSTVVQAASLGGTALHADDLVTRILAWVTVVLLVLPFLGFAALLARAVRIVVENRRARRAGTLPVEPWQAPAEAPLRTQEVPVDMRVNVTAADAGPTVEPTVPPAADVPEPEGDARPDAPAADVPEPEGDARPDAPAADDPLTAASFTEETMLRQRRTPPERGVRRALFTASGGWIDLGPSAAERRRTELVSRLARPLHECRRIVVLSRKGGAGKTTTALMLGHVLAMHRGDRIVALDANPDAGSLPYRVTREGNASVTTLLRDVDRLTSYADVRNHTSQAPTRLEIVASDDDPRITRAMSQADYKRAIDLLDRHFMVVLLDTGTGILDDAIQGILTEADQIVVVMPPALDGARVAASTLDWLREHGYGGLVRGAVAVINGVRGDGGLVQIDKIERHFAARCSGVVRIPFDRSLEAGARTGPGDLRRRTLDAYLELGAAVADGFAMPGRRTPGRSMPGRRP